MAKDLQSIVDSLGRRLARAVAIDDPHMRLLAYNSHFGPVDEVRRASIMHRKAPANGIVWAHQNGIRTATEPVRMPPNPTIPMDARVCAPIRVGGELLGYLWLVDVDQTLTDQDLLVVKAAAETAGEVLHVERLVDEVQRGRERELLRDLLSDEPNLRRQAANELVEANLFVPTRAGVALVVQLRGGSGAITSSERLALRSALDQIRQTLTPRHSLDLIRPDHAVLVVASEDRVLRVTGIAGLAEQVLTAVRARLSRSGREVLIGLGDACSAVADIARSYERARQATRVAEIVPSFAPVATWSELGIYRVLLQFPLEQVKANVLHPGLQMLVADPTNNDLVETLETFLDLAGSAKRTAARLKLHRATLYYRLRRVEELIGMDLESGDDRLALHLGLKLARLGGLLPEVDASPSEGEGGPRQDAGTVRDVIPTRQSA